MNLAALTRQVKGKVAQDLACGRVIRMEVAIDEEQGGPRGEAFRRKPFAAP